MIGFLLAKDRSFWSAIRRVLLFAVTGMLLLGAVLSALGKLGRHGGKPRLELAGLAARIARIFYAWLAIVSMLGLAQRYLNRPQRRTHLHDRGDLPLVHPAPDDHRHGRLLADPSGSRRLGRGTAGDPRHVRAAAPCSTNS